MTVGEVVDRSQLVVCVGSGGVGKTTVSAALALGAALRGRRAAVLTIDPARALARALGLPRLGAQAERIADERFHDAGLRANGTLHAAMLDQKSAWDAFIRRHAPSPEIADAITTNTFYEQLSTRFAGATEYVAMEELCRLAESNQYDLIVLDTPPSAHALDFVTAPARIDELLDPKVSHWLARPYRTVQRGAFSATSSMLRYVLRRLERATGQKTFRDVAELFGYLEALREDIGRRSKAARKLLFAEHTAFVLVAGPQQQVLAESEELLSQVDALGVPLRAAVLNRVHPLLDIHDAARDAISSELLAELGDGGPAPEVAGWIQRTHRLALALAQAESARMQAFAAPLPANIAWASVPELDHDLHSLADLNQVAATLWARAGKSGRNTGAT